MSLVKLINNNRPVIGLSPMDGVTDAPFRLITQKYSNPDVIYTEFVHVMGLCRGSESLYEDLIYAEQERPIIAQIFGAEPEYYYHAAKIICKLGFDGIDINMGCPAKSVAQRGAGAALIDTPELAKQIVRETKRGVADWVDTGELTGVDQHIPQQIERLQRLRLQSGVVGQADRIAIPVSVKTRIGYRNVVVGDWVKHLTEVEPFWIAIHGRTLHQMYQGQSDWEALAQAVAATDLPVLVNGDVKTHGDVDSILEQTEAAGVLIGRATYGNPWWFRNIHNKLPPHNSTVGEKLQVLQEHADLHWRLKSHRSFVQVRKHLGWYTNGFEHAADLRKSLVRVDNPGQVRSAVAAWQAEYERIDSAS